MNRLIEPSEDTVITVPWGQVSARWWGSQDSIPIICIHGWQDNAATFDRLLPLLPANFSFLCIDLPGHGLSTKLPEGCMYYLVWDATILLRRIQKQFGWSHITIMGHSLGAIIGFLYASVYPNDVDTLIALDAVAPLFECSGKSRIPQLGEFIDKFLYYDEVKNLKDPVDDYESMITIAVNGHGGRVTRKGCEVLMTRGMVKNGDGKYVFTRDNRVKVGWLAPSTPDFVRDCAARIKCRYLNVKATPYDKETWPAYKEVCDIISLGSREFKLVFVNGSHHVHLNEPEKVAPCIIDFLLYSNSDQFCII